MYFYSQSTLGAGFVLPNGISAGVYSQRGFAVFFYATEGMNNFTGCSPWDDFVALRRLPTVMPIMPIKWYHSNLGQDKH